MIILNELPPGRKTPGAYLEYNTNVSARGLAPTATRVLLVGQRGADGEVAADVVVTDLTSAADAGRAWGFQSVMYQMARAAYATNPNITLHGVAVDDAGSSTDAAGSLALSGTATRAGTAYFRVGSYVARVGIVVGATAAQVAVLAEAALEAILGLPATVAVATATINFTAFNTGTIGNTLRLAVDFGESAGLTVAVTQFASGATDPSASGALDAVAADQYDIIAFGFTDATNVGLLQDHLVDVSDALTRKPGVGIYGWCSTYGTAVSSAAAVNDGRIVAAWQRNGYSTAAEVAAAVAAALAAEPNPARPINGAALAGLVAAEAADRHTGAEIEAALENGVAALTVNRSGGVEVVRSVTTFTVDGDGFSDESLLDIQTIRSLDYYRAQVGFRYAQKYQNVGNTAEVRDAIRADVIDVAHLLERPPLQVLHNVDAYEDGFIVEADPSEPTKAVGRFPAPVIPGLHVFGGVLDLYLEG